MNGVRSIFMRKGYLLTALAAAVLLAASSGTAYAQSVGFTSTSGTLPEGATSGSRTGAPLHIYVEISGIKDDPATTNVNEAVTSTSGAGTISILHNLDTSDLTNDILETDGETNANARRLWQIVGGDPVAIRSNDASGYSADDHSLKYRGNGRLELVIIDPEMGEDTNWKDEKFTLKLESTSAKVSPSPGVFNLTIVDDEVAPVAKFSKPSISLTEDSITTFSVSISPGTKDEDIQGGLVQGPITLSIHVAGADMVGACTMGTGDDETKTKKAMSITIGGADGDEIDISKTTSTFTVAADPAPLGDAKSAAFGTFTVTACEDDAGFRDPEVTLSFVDKTLMAAAGAAGPLGNAGSMTIMVQSNEDVPTVEFSTSRIDIDEGGTNTVAILASAATGPEVGSVMVSVSGDAMLSLWQDDDMLEANAAGMYEVDLMGDANTILTISADSDRALEDGMMATGTITLESASGADIGDRDSVMVTVIGSTAVSALPLVGQLLLALFLMAGGARLYRRRQG